MAQALSCSGLMALLAHSGSAAEVLLLDVRPYSEYALAHLRGAISVRLSSLLLRRLAAHKVQLADVLLDAHKADYLRRTASPECRLVVYDAASTAADVLRQAAAPQQVAQPQPLAVICAAVQRAGLPCYFLDGESERARARLTNTDKDGRTTPTSHAGPSDRLGNSGASCPWLS